MVDLEEIKQHLRVEHNDEDTYITMLESAAVSHVAQYLNRKLFADSVPEDESNGMVITDDVRVAILLIIGHLYENRSDVADKPTHELPMSSKILLNPYRIINL